MLFVPGHNDRLLNKASTLKVDAVVPDIEDSVVAKDKEKARQKVAERVRRGDFSDKYVFPRINDRESGFCLKDLQALTIEGVDGFMYPKSESKLDVYFIDKLLDTIECEKGFEIGTFKIILLIETPAAVLNVMEICLASKRVVAIAFGCEDFVADLGGIPSTKDGDVLYIPRAMIAMAAKATGIVPIDTVHIDIHNLEDLEENVKLASKLGFEGMLLLHPKEIELVHKYFTPSEEAIKEAEEIIRLSESSGKAGRGVDLVNGKFVGPPLVRGAERLLRRAKEINK
jgi:citrate lyase subunit beta/citryl-CoA lyase